MKRLLLVRHGETAWNRDDRIQGWAQVSLTDRGRHQATATAAYLADREPDVDAVISSDLPRAAETASILHSRAYPETPLREEAGWRERDFGVFQGYDSAEFFTEYPEYAVIENGRAAAENTPEKGESYLEFRDRIRSEWSALTDRIDGDTVVLVVHGGVIRVIVAMIEGLDFGTAIREVSPGNGSVTVIGYDCGRDEAEILARDERDHLGRHRV